MQTCQPYSIPPCDHHVDDGHYGPCGATVKTPKCEKKCISSYNVTYNDDKHHAASVYSVKKNVEQIQTELMTHGPVEASFTVYAVR